MSALCNDRVVRRVQADRTLLLFNSRIDIILLSSDALESDLEPLVLDLSHEVDTENLLRSREFVLAFLGEIIIAVADNHGSSLVVLYQARVRAELAQPQDHDENLMVVLEDRASAQEPVKLGLLVLLDLNGRMRLRYASSIQGIHTIA